MMKRAVSILALLAVALTPACSSKGSAPATGKPASETSAPAVTPPLSSDSDKALKAYPVPAATPAETKTETAAPAPAATPETETKVTEVKTAPAK